ncbi:crocetin glucoside glucosyltransferase-like protein [Carex littledalei]|uniref:Glycosyltransferase n=1 Tax=Carex littledalei TaxID=544730 RepID=A0A833VE33_9POAL|nr:crocetin glucoside glucosyltransferase-like protein [Carex littledalei]
MNMKGKSYRVLMFPWLAHGHILPFFELARRLCGECKDMVVYVCSTPINLQPVRNLLHLAPRQGEQNDDDSDRSRIELVELHLPSFPDLPPHLHTTKYLPPDLMPSLKHAFDLSEPSFSGLLDTIQPNLLIYDFLQPWACLAAQRRGIPGFTFMTSGAAQTSFFCHYSHFAEEEFPFSAIRLGTESRRYTEMLDKSANGMSDRDRLLNSFKLSSQFIAIKSFRDIESKYIEYLSFLAGKEVVPVGPLVPDNYDHLVDAEQLKRVMEWLGKKGRKSVVFVSFGTEYFLSEQEMEQMACGLELSGADFIWVVRFPKEEKEADGRRNAKATRAMKLPPGFMDRIGPERGLVVDSWAPQRSILAHPSLGAFLTHCGWSSLMEGMQSGVPMIALPLHLDQPLNAKLMVELGVAIEIPQQGFGNFKGEDVARGTREVLHSEIGHGVRKKVEEMAEAMQRKGDHHEIQELVEKMLQLCNKDEQGESNMLKEMVAN